MAQLKVRIPSVHRTRVGGSMAVCSRALGKTACQVPPGAGNPNPPHSSQRPTPPLLPRRNEDTPHETYSRTFPAAWSKRPERERPGATPGAWEKAQGDCPPEEESPQRPEDRQAQGAGQAALAVPSTGACGFFGAQGRPPCGARETVPLLERGHPGAVPMISVVPELSVTTCHSTARPPNSSRGPAMTSPSGAPAA